MSASQQPGAPSTLPSTAPRSPVSPARFRRVAWIVLDSAGIGEMPDADRYGDRGASTIVHAAASVGGLNAPNLARLGLGRLADIPGVPPALAPDAIVARLAEASPGKDTTTGHWEMAGVVLDQAFQTFTDTGFPPEIMEEFRRESGFEWMGNYAASGTAIIEELGPEHQRTGKLIVYTSADSVFQIAAHEGSFGLDNLYRACEVARRILTPHRIARVIARPFVGTPGNYHRTYNRHDYSMVPDHDTVLDLLVAAGVPVLGIGKIQDIFAGRGVPESIHTEGNTDGLNRTLGALQSGRPGLIYTNLVDFDMQYGHRRDPVGYARALEEVDAFLPRILEALGDDGLLLITADHGCDPTASWSTDHTREYVPLILWHRGIGPGQGRLLPTRDTFADMGATVGWALGVGPLRHGTAIQI